MKNWLVIVLLGVGVVVGVVSLYMASLSGVMNKMGLLGGDFEGAIDSNKLARQLRGQSEQVECGIWQVSKHVPEYFFAKGVERIQLAGHLGGERVVCGIRLVQRDNIERGVYTMIKGMYYLKSYYAGMESMVRGDAQQCSLLKSPDYERSVEAYLSATQGRVHEVVLDVYKQVEGARNKVEELCTN